MKEGRKDGKEHERMEAEGRKERRNVCILRRVAGAMLCGGDFAVVVVVVVVAYMIVVGGGRWS